jgi:long-subunit fatty acid transport protein
MNRCHRRRAGGRSGGLAVLRAVAWVLLAVGAVVWPAPRARAAGVEHPDVGTIAIGRGGAYAADPSDGLAMIYNPAGFAAQTGLRLTLDGNLAWQGLSFTPAPGVTPQTTASNSAGGFLVPALAVSYGFGAVGPLSGLTVALGATGPSAIGKESFPADGPQRYSLIASDYFIVYGSAAVAASLGKWLSVGITLQGVSGNAKFSQAVWSGPFVGTAPNQDAVAHVDVTRAVTSSIPTAVFGVTARPLPPLALGLSFRPGFNFVAHGTLTTDLPMAQQQALNIEVVGDRTNFFIPFPHVIRFGAQYQFNSRWLVEANLVGELWSSLHTIEIRPQDIHIKSNSFGTDRTLQTIVFQKDYDDSLSLRVGGDYVVLPGRLTVRAGYLHETSAIPARSVSIDFGNWQRDMVSVGGSVRIVRGIEASFAYAHHFLADQNVTNSQVVQVITPCLTPGCTEPAPTAVGNGVYKGSLDVASLSLRLILDDLRVRP